jgi:hypothetical protein
VSDDSKSVRPDYILVVMMTNTYEQMYVPQIIDGIILQHLRQAALLYICKQAEHAQS